jgi:cell division protein FtsW (lipid II flippase)
MYAGLAFIIVGLIPTIIGYYTIFSSQYVLGQSIGNLEQRTVYPAVGVMLIVAGVIILFYERIYKKVKPDLTVRVVR